MLVIFTLFYFVYLPLQSERSREMQSRLSISRKRSRPSSMMMMRRSSASSTDTGGEVRAESLPLAHLRPLTGASTPQTQGRHYRRSSTTPSCGHSNPRNSKLKGACGAHCPVQRWTAEGRSISVTEGETVSTKGLSNNQTHLVQVLTGKCTDLVNRLKAVEEHMKNGRSIEREGTQDGRQNKQKSLSYVPERDQTLEAASFEWREDHIYRKGILAQSLKIVR